MVAVPVTYVALPAAVQVQLTVHTTDERYRPIDAEQGQHPPWDVIAHRQHPAILQASHQTQ
jgi:hypothetical protein